MVISKDIRQIVGTYDGANLANILNNIQRINGFLSHKIVDYISFELKIPSSKIYETASFYSFFSFEKKGAHVIRVCDSMTCHMKGSSVLETIKDVTGLGVGEYNDRFRVEVTSCIGCCDKAPAVLLDDVAYTELDDVKVRKILECVDTVSAGAIVGRCDGSLRILKKTRFRALKKANGMSPCEVIEVVKKSGLLGRGGAGFPVWMKWDAVNKSAGEGILICNFDEGEPGTFKDKFILLNNAQTLIEGIAIACYAIGCGHAYIYFRREYSYLKELLQSAIDSALKYVRDLEIEIIEGAGAYICGDETCMLNSIEGKAGRPRHKPPFPAQRGLWDKPTAINNVETLTNAALLFDDEGWSGEYRLFSVSGDVKNAGVFEEKIGISFGELIKKANPIGKVKAIFFGAAGGCVPYDDERCLDFEDIKKAGAILGSCGIIVVCENRSIVELCRNITRFFVYENCGKCTPCRDGNYQILKIFDKIIDGDGAVEDISVLEELCYFVQDSAFCALGQSSCNHIICSLKYFRDEFDELCKLRAG
ncbi:MAG: hypothetical protein DRN71_05520 [Candidatus Nanohalarchaeota archaeon]|nr:MAG: hypothetical protein DRN71_05520 [Candidatus Nanohaloarchaeota archaeon]